MLKSTLMGLIVSIGSVVIAVPFSYIITIGVLRRYCSIIMLLCTICLFTAYIVRVYAWRAILGREGVLVNMLDLIGVDGSLNFYGNSAVAITLMSVLIPAAILPLVSSMSSIDHNVILASRSLGANNLVSFFTIIAPLASRGIFSAMVLTFVVGAADFVTPQLVGGSSTQMLGSIIARQFGESFNWPLGAALAFSFAAVLGIVILGFRAIFNMLGLRDRP